MIKKTRKKVFKGGKVFASGGFGCVFRPALKCKGSNSTQRKEGYISKLMLNKYADKEEKLIKQAYDVVRNIPNFKRYFLVYDYQVCEPEVLNSNDLLDFDNKCKGVLPDKANYINSHLYNYKIMTFPDGGIDISHWIDTYFDKYADMNFNRSLNIADLLWNLNTSLVNLLYNGISKLQKYSYYHMDIKAQNVLTDKKGNSAKLIDYGLAFKDNTNKVPNELKNRALLFNTPFTILLFQKPFIQILLRKLNKIFKDDDSLDLTDDNEGRKTLIQPAILETLKEFIYQENSENLNYLNSGHWKYLQYFYRDLFEQLFEETEEGDSISNFNKQLSTDYYRYNFITEYLSEAVNKFIIWNKFPLEFDEDSLWSKAFKYNVDIFGFLTIYQNIISASYLSKVGYKELTGSLNGWKHISLFQRKVIEILGEYLLNEEYAIKPFPINNIVDDLRKLGLILSPATSNPSSFKKSPIWSGNYSLFSQTKNKTRKSFKGGRK